MAKKIENEKGFLVIEASAREIYIAAGGIGICDRCNSPAEVGYYIAVLNCWYCPKCYAEWYQNAINYPEDRDVELRNYKFYSERLGV